MPRCFRGVKKEKEKKKNRARRTIYAKQEGGHTRANIVYTTTAKRGSSIEQVVKADKAALY